MTIMTQVSEIEKSGSATLTLSMQLKTEELTALGSSSKSVELVALFFQNHFSRPF